MDGWQQTREGIESGGIEETPDELALHLLASLELVSEFKKKLGYLTGAFPGVDDRDILRREKFFPSESLGKRRTATDVPGELSGDVRDRPMARIGQRVEPFLYRYAAAIQRAKLEKKDSDVSGA